MPPGVRRRPATGRRPPRCRTMSGADPATPISLARKATCAVGLACVMTLVVWAWAASRLPASWSVMHVSAAGHGGGSHALMHGGAGATSQIRGVSVADLTADPKRPADVSVTLVARQER